MTDLLQQDPVSGYQNIYKEAFAREAEALFEDAVRKGGIDPEHNAVQARTLDRLIQEKESHDGRKTLWILLITALVIGLAVWGIILWNDEKRSALNTGLFSAYAAAVVILSFALIIPAIKKLSARISELEKEIREKYAAATEYLFPLYSSFSWNTFPALISRIIPQLQFDDFLTTERLADFKENFGLLIQDEPESTMTGSHSGTFFGYPFVLTEDRNFHWGEQVWSNSITVSYTVYVTGPDGKRTSQTRTEILTASVTKPCPEFQSEKNLFFAHDAAPELSYSRSPSSLSGEKGFFTALGKKYRMHKLRKLEQNLTDESQYTMMSNREFEVLYKSENRDHEIGFRLLFTPLAQQYMVKLLNDTGAGYGDDFCLRKTNRITCIASEHLNSTPVAQEPFYTDMYDLQKIKASFMANSEDFFRRIYFAFAPLFLIPLYNEPRIDPPAAGPETVSENELEGAAFYYSEHYKPPQSITENIFNIGKFRRSGAVVSAVVESIGFRGETHVEYIPRTAGNGRVYTVPVEWVEYIPVTQCTPIHACKEADLPPGTEVLFRRRGVAFW